MRSMAATSVLCVGLLLPAACAPTPAPKVASFRQQLELVQSGQASEIVVVGETIGDDELELLAGTDALLKLEVDNLKGTAEGLKHRSSARNLERDVLRGSRNLWLWRPVDLVWLHHNWHREHHLQPTAQFVLKQPAELPSVGTVARVLEHAEHQIAGFELLAEMLQRPAFRPAEIDSERQVVIEEINMNEDDPGDLAHEEFFQAVFAGHPLERPVLGTRQSITGMTHDDLAGYWKRRYRAGSAVVAVAGSIEHDAVVDLASRYFGEWDGVEVDHELQALQTAPHARVVNRPTEQAHLVIGGNGFKRADDRRFVFEVLNHVLGGGLSSRLFRTIREERGLAYAVYSFRAPYADAGAWGVYAGTTPSQAFTVLELIHAEIDDLIKEGVTVDELGRAKGNMRGAMALALEDPNGRMVRLGRDELTGMEHLSVDEKIERIDAVTASEVQEVAETVLSGVKVIGAVGPFEGVEFEEFLT